MKKMNNIGLTLNKSEFDSEFIQGSLDCRNVMMRFFCNDIDLFESFFLLILNRANKTTGYVKISQGGTAGTVVDLKIVAKYAIDSLATSVVIAHNHPSGNTTPSSADRAITRKIADGLNLFDIKLLDHIILTSESYYSFADNGDL